MHHGLDPIDALDSEDIPPTVREFVAVVRDAIVTAGSPREEDMDAVWTFGGRWDPASIPPVLPFASMPLPENGARFVDFSRALVRWKAARNATGYRVYFDTVNPPKFRAESARYLGDPAFEELIGALRRSSPEFCEAWKRHEVAQSGEGRKDMRHPEVGMLSFALR